jgi:6-phosphogluconolactonase (cycloisomerase 2 family)
MRSVTRLSAAVTAAAAALAVAGGSASATGGSRAVFVQTDNTAGNQIVVYDRAVSGAVTQAGTYNTGGLGGQLPGSVVDHLASQGSLAYDRENGLLYAVNAGSNTISVFAVLGDQLALRQTIGSGGKFPASITVHQGVVYVLNAKDGGRLQGFAVHAGALVAIPGSGRALGLATSEEPQFVHTPGQVQFSPSGSQLIVTTKAAGSAIEVFGVSPISGRPSPSPVVNPEPGTVPFAVTFDREGHLIVAEAGTNALASFALAANGTVSLLNAVGTGQAATCWVVTADGRYLFASNAGSASLTAFQAGGQSLTSLGNTTTDGGTVDATTAENGRFLYVQTGAAGIVDEYAIGAKGALTAIGSVTVPGALGGEGIAAG